MLVSAHNEGVSGGRGGGSLKVILSGNATKRER